MTVTLGATTDGPQENERAREWPAWAVPPAAVGVWVELQVAVEALRRRGTGLPCERGPERWWASSTTLAGRVAVEEAVQGCRWCPVRVECLAYAAAAGERDGVWGGLTPAQRRGALR